jgi:hypothetical protein
MTKMDCTPFQLLPTTAVPMSPWDAGGIGTDVVFFLES